MRRLKLVYSLIFAVAVTPLITLAYLYSVVEIFWERWVEDL